MAARAPCLAGRPAQDVAINRDHLALAGQMHGLPPRLERALQLRGVQGGKDPTKGVVRRCPRGRSSKRRNHGSLACAKVATRTALSAPLKMAQSASTRMSRRRWSWFHALCGSGIGEHGRAYSVQSAPLAPPAPARFLPGAYPKRFLPATLPQNVVALQENMRRPWEAGRGAKTFRLLRQNVYHKSHRLVSHSVSLLVIAKLQLACYTRLFF